MKESVVQLAGAYNNRFEQFLLSVDEATIMAGKKTEKMKMLEDSEQFEARRELLMVEELANRKREMEATAENNFIMEVEQRFHDSLVESLDEQLNDFDHIFENTLKFNEHLAKMLDILYTESCSISRLVACIENITWLETALIKFVRQPKYRRLDSQGHPLIVKTLRQALSFIGVESLRLLIPVLVSKQIMPPHSDFTPDLLKHLWLYTIGTGNVAKSLAPNYGLKPHFGFNIGLLSTIGRSVVASYYLKSFDAKLRESIIEARNDNNPIQAKALASLSPSHKYLVSFWKRYANRVTFEIVNKLNLRWLMITAGFEDYLKIKEISFKYVEKHQLHPLTQLLFKSQGYMQFKLLQKANLMNKQASMLYLRNFGVKAEDVALVSKVNLAGLELKIAEKYVDE